MTKDMYATEVDCVKRYVDEHFIEPINLDVLAELVSMTRFSLSKRFRQQMGISPYQYVCQVRVQHAQALIEGGERPSIIACAVGFFDQSHLSRHFKRRCGVTPSQYRARWLKLS